MVKWKGQVASVAPSVSGLALSLGSSVSPLALATAIAAGGLMMGAHGLQAGTCSLGPVSVCSGAAGADTTQNISGSPVSVTATAGFGMNVAVGNALRVTGTGGTSVNVGNAIISAQRIGLYVTEQGAGAFDLPPEVPSL